MSLAFTPLDKKLQVETQIDFPGAVTATLCERVMDKKEIRQLFMEWLRKI